MAKAQTETQEIVETPTQTIPQTGEPEESLYGLYSKTGRVYHVILALDEEDLKDVLRSEIFPKILTSTEPFMKAMDTMGFLEWYETTDIRRIGPFENSITIAPRLGMR